MPWLMVIALLLPIADIGPGQGKWLEEVRFPLLLPAVRVGVAAVSPLLLRLHLEAALAEYRMVEYYDFTAEADWVAGAFAHYCRWSLAATLGAGALLTAVLAYCMWGNGLAGAKGIRAACRVSMALALLGSVGYSLTTLNKFFDLSCYIALLALCQNGYFYLPQIAKGLLARRQPVNRAT